MSAQIRKIAVPTDFSDLSERAIAYAASMARGSGASLYLIHVLKDQAQYDRARARLMALAERFTGGISRVTIEVRDGEAADSIAEAALHYGADLVVIATHARTGLAHLLSGSVAERLIRVAWCPVLVPPRPEPCESSGAGPGSPPNWKVRRERDDRGCEQGRSWACPASGLLTFRS